VLLNSVGLEKLEPRNPTNRRARKLGGKVRGGVQGFCRAKCLGGTFYTTHREDINECNNRCEFYIFKSNQIKYTLLTDDKNKRLHTYYNS